MKETSWIIGDKHPIYGEVQMMGTTGGEPYRWFIDGDGVVSMIPLDMLEQKENEKEESSTKSDP